jgi:hypothetical protein
MYFRELAIAGIKKDLNQNNLKHLEDKNLD